VLLHGGNQSSHSWDLVSLHLADRYHVYALDQRGHGDSEWSRELDYSIDAMASDALAFIADQRLAGRRRGRPAPGSQAVAPAAAASADSAAARAWRAARASLVTAA
jgi:hypothetical protein